ncbi:MAG: amidohydrolase family protein [Chloroflexota bacterium]|nr:amidohydrolase family protein [Chloroflexota bacterium]
MIVDAHVSIDSRQYPIDRAMEVLRGANVSEAVVFADAHAEDLTRENAYVLEVSRRFPVIPFYYLGGNPWTDTRLDSLDIPDTIVDYAGIRWHRWIGEGIDRTGELDESELDWAINLMESAEFEALVSAAAHYNLPVIFEESYAVTVEFALRYPALDVIIPHLGARSGGELNMVHALWDAPNVYFDTSLAPIDEATLQRIGTGRLLYASSYPYGDPDTELDKIDRLPIPEEVKEDIYGENILSLLSRTALA